MFQNGAQIIVLFAFLALTTITLSLKQARLIAYPPDWEISEKFKNTRDIPNSRRNATSSICLFGTTRLFLSNESTTVFVQELLTFLGEVSLRSFQSATSEQTVTVLIPVTDEKPHFLDWNELAAFVQPMIKEYSRVIVDFSPNSYNESLRRVSTSNCEWIVSVNLDADDILVPGYIDWIINQILPTLDKGAIVASRRLPRLHYGFNRCNLDVKQGLLGKLGTWETCPYWSGWATGQTRILRRDIFESLDRPLHPVPHALALSQLRSAIITNLLKQIPPVYLHNDFELAKNYTLFESIDNEMELITGIKMIDSTDAGFGPAGIYTKTPLSSHFPFAEVSTYDYCSKEKWEEVISNANLLNQANQSYDYLYEWGQKSKITFYHMCKSSIMYKKERKFHGKFRETPCNIMEHQLQEELEAAAKELQNTPEDEKSLKLELENVRLRTDVCIYAETKIFFTKNATKVYVNDLLKFFRDVSLRSLSESLAENQIQIQVIASIPTFNPLFPLRRNLRDFLQPVFRKYKNVRVDYSSKAFKHAHREFKLTKCKWVILTKFDVDDLLAPQYLDWIVHRILPKLKQGAMIRSRRLPQINYGFDRCYTTSKLITSPHWSGFTVGQTRVFRRDLFLKLGLPFQSDPPNEALTNLRSLVWEKVFEKPSNHLDNEIILDFENQTGLRLVDTTTEGFGPAGIYVRSPISYRFPFNDIVSSLQCSVSMWRRTVTNATRYNIFKRGTYDYLYDWGQHSDMTLYDMCTSSYFSQLHQFKLFGDIDCSQIDAKFRKLLT
jgi:hypothetical protein